MGEMRICPLLLNPAEYNPDTLNLLEDSEARDFWLDTFEKIADKHVAYALQNNLNDDTARERAEEYKKCYIQAIDGIRKDFISCKKLSVRLLLDLNEYYLRSQGFVDLWCKQKTLENSKSLSTLKERLDEIDNIQDEDRKWTELTRGLLAGNMFDWGARAISDILETNVSFGLKEAMEKIQKRPWLVDGLDKWLVRLKSTPHNCAAVFVDNSGVDVILGVLPYIRQLLKRNTSVIMCANSEPALNDITYSELQNVITKASEICETLKSASENGKLSIMKSGQKGPCLDLLTLDTELCRAIEDKNVDLLIIEGMGRALHTNLEAKFNCECLKMAVVKNPWLAKRLGGDIFSVICQYEALS